MRRWLPHSRQLGAALASDGTVIDVRSMEDADDLDEADTDEPAQLEQPEPEP